MACDGIKSKDINLPPIYKVLTLHLMLEQAVGELITQDKQGHHATQAMAKREYNWRLEQGWCDLLKGWPSGVRDVAHLKGR